MDLSESELRALIARREGRELEFKQGLPRDEKTARSLCAFANTRGGTLLIGVTDKGAAFGVPRPKEVMSELRRIAAELINPPLEVQTTAATFEGECVVAARVNASRSKPHAVLRAHAEPEIVVRVGASNRVATGATLQALRNSSRMSRPSDSLERRIVDWIASRGEKTLEPGGDATVARFSQTMNVGGQRARRAFLRLEREGYLVAHGHGAARVYTLA